MVILSHSAGETERIAAKIAKGLLGGEVIALDGQLGSGKTVFCKGLARALKIKEPITSPTFSIMNVYTSGRLRLMHCDAYRLDSVEDAENAGITDYLGQKDCVCIIEWPQNIALLLDGYKTIAVKIKYTGENTREINIC